MRKPFRYYGGKGNLVPKLLELIPPHDTYIEVFSGSAALLFAKSPVTSKLEVLNDFNSDIVNFYRVLRDKEKLDVLIRKIEFTPYSREEYDYCKSTLDDLLPDSVERAYRWFIVASMSMSGMIGKAWSCNVKPNGAQSKVWAKIPENLKDFHYRLKQVQVEHKDFRKLIPLYDREENFQYMDPPYISDTRINKKVYEKEMTKDDHKELVELLLNSKGKFVLSGYAHSIYKPLEKNGWHRSNIRVSCAVSGKKRTSRTEVLWFNFVPKKESATFRMEGPDQTMSEKGTIFKIEGPPMSKEELEEEMLKAKAQALLFQVLGFRRGNFPN